MVCSAFILGPSIPLYVPFITHLLFLPGQFHQEACKCGDFFGGGGGSNLLLNLTPQLTQNTEVMQKEDCRT